MMNDFQGVSEDENQDMMEEDYRPFEDALVNAEDDLQHDDIAANDVQAERKSRAIYKGCQSFLSMSFLFRKVKDLGAAFEQECFRYRPVLKSRTIEN